jgi:hypothetical protein
MTPGGRVGSALFSSLNHYCEPSQQFSKLVLVDQKVEDGRQRTQCEHKIPHGQSPARLHCVPSCIQIVMLTFRPMLAFS